jgi:hypothetical protein
LPYEDFVGVAGIRKKFKNLDRIKFSNGRRLYHARDKEKSGDEKLSQTG